jgi:hypothetical protein
MILQKHVNDIDFRNMNVYEQIWYELGFLPNRFHREFLQDVIFRINEQDSHSVSKNWEFYFDTIQEELTEDELNGDYWSDIGCIGPFKKEMVI